MSIKYGEPLLFKPQNVCKRSGRIKVLSNTNKVEDGLSADDAGRQRVNTLLAVTDFDLYCSHTK